MAVINHSAQLLLQAMSGHCLHKGSYTRTFGQYVRKVFDVRYFKLCCMKIHTERYLNFCSHHHSRTCTGVVKTLKHRALSICVPSKQQEELQHLRSLFGRNGYPERVIDPIMRRSRPIQEPTPRRKGRE